MAYTSKSSSQLTIDLSIALYWPLLIQNIYLISPIRSVTDCENQFTISQRITTYHLVMFFLYCFFIGYISISQNDTTLALNRANGLLWSLLFICLSIMGKLSFILIVALTLHYRHDELRLLHRISDFDKRIKLHHQLHLNNANLCRTNFAVLLTYLVYTWIILIISVVKLIQPNVHKNLYIFAYSFTYYVESTAFSIMILKFVNYLAIIWNRLQTLGDIVERLREEHQQEDEEEEKVANEREMKAIRVLYKELIECVEHFTNFAGWPLIIKLAHDFFLCTSIGYLIFTILMEDASRYRMITGLSVWYCQTLQRELFLSLFANLTLSQVYICTYRIQKYIVNFSPYLRLRQHGDQ